MLLRLIDLGGSDDSANAVQVCLQAEEQTITFTIDDFSSPVSAEFYKNLAWYFQHYLQLSDSSVANDRNVGEGLLRKGLKLGDSLLGEDFELMKVSDLIEAKGYANVCVRLESSRVEFFQTCWELLVLSDARYVLSTVSQEFVRCFKGPDPVENEDEVTYELHGPTAPDADDAAPLGLVHIIARNDDDKRPVDGLNICTRSLRWAGAINYELWPCEALEALQQRLSDSNRPVHCIHYDGPIHLLNGMPHIFPGVQLQSGAPSLSGAAQQSAGKVTPPRKVEAASLPLVPAAPLALDTVCRLLAQHKVALLSIDACAYLDDNHNPIDAASGLAMVAQVAAEAGLPNVIGLSHLTDPWTASNCFELLYDKLLLGFSIGQAVVETRKQLQTQLETKRFRVKGIPFHTWPLPVHYGGQAVRFFEQPQQSVELVQSPAYQAIHRRLFGFHSHYLPPEVHHCDDQSLMTLLSEVKMADGSIFRLEGSSGSGKTHLVHQAGFYWAQQQQIGYGFYFDMSAGFYSRSDVQQMIAPVFDCEAGDSEKLDAAVREHRCYFVFDNLDKPALSQWPEATEAAIAELTEYLTQLAQQRHVVVVTGREEQGLMDVSPICIEPLHPLSQRLLAAESLRSGKVDVGETDWLPLLECLRGNPFLIQKVTPQLANQSSTELIAVIESWSKETPGDSVTHYYRWQWGELPSPWQRLLRLIADLPSVPLEMLSLACRPRTKPVENAPEQASGNADDASEKPEQTWFEPAAQLFSQLGAPLEAQPSGFNAALDCWQRAGMLLQRPYGTIVDPRFQAFIARDLKEDNDPADVIDDILLSQILCESIRQVAQHLQQQQNPLMSQYLLANRRHWVKHFEALWFGRCFRDFVRVKQTFDALLRTVGLESESIAWTMDLLSRTPAVTTPEDLEAAASWLRLAYHALAADKKEQSSLLADAASQWKDWLMSQEIGDQPHPCFRLAAQWLPAFYQRQEQWPVCYAISETVYRHDRHHQNWPFVIEALKRLAQCSVALQNEEQASAYETRLLEELPFEQLPPNLHTQLTLQVAGARVARGQPETAQALVTQLREVAEAKALKPVLDGLQADIDYQQERYPEALNGYCSLWETTMTSSQPGGADRKYLQQRLKDLQEKLGEDRFDVVCQQTLGRMIHPDELD